MFIFASSRKEVNNGTSHAQNPFFAFLIFLLSCDPNLARKPGMSLIMHLYARGGAAQETWNVTVCVLDSYIDLRVHQQTVSE